MAKRGSPSAIGLPAFENRLGDLQSRQVSEGLRCCPNRKKKDKDEDEDGDHDADGGDDDDDDDADGDDGDDGDDGQAANSYK